MTDSVGAVWADAESSFQASRSGEDGSAYSWLPNAEIVRGKVGNKLLETNFQNADNWPSAPQIGPEEWEVALKFPVRGLSAAGAAAASPPSEATDVDHLLIYNAMGAYADRDGIAVGVGSDADTLVLGSAGNTTDQELVPVYESGLLTPDRMQWVRAMDDSSDPSIEVSPDFAANPTNSAIAYASRIAYFDRTFSGSLALIAQWGTNYYRLLGGKVMDWTTEIPDRDIAWHNMTVRGGEWERISAPASLPAPTASIHGGVVAMRSAFYWNGSAISISKATINWNLEAVHRAGQDGSHGITAGRHIKALPEIVVDPLFTTALEDDWTNQTQGEIHYQIGAAVPSGGVANGCLYSVANARISAFEKEGRAGERGVSATFTPAWAGEFSAGVAQRMVQWARV